MHMHFNFCSNIHVPSFDIKRTHTREEASQGLQAVSMYPYLPTPSAQLSLHMPFPTH